jgi:hypothetical protein
VVHFHSQLWKIDIYHILKNKHLVAVYYNNGKPNLFRIHVDVKLVYLKHYLDQLNGPLKCIVERRVPVLSIVVCRSRQTRYVHQHETLERRWCENYVLYFFLSTVRRDRSSYAAFVRFFKIYVQAWPVWRPSTKSQHTWFNLMTTKMK